MIIWYNSHSKQRQPLKWEKTVGFLFAERVSSVVKSPLRSQEMFPHPPLSQGNENQRSKATHLRSAHWLKEQYEWQRAIFWLHAWQLVLIENEGDRCLLSFACNYILTSWKWEMNCENEIWNFSPRNAVYVFVVMIDRHDWSLFIAVLLCYITLHIHTKLNWTLVLHLGDVFAIPWLSWNLFEIIYVVNFALINYL